MQPQANSNFDFILNSNQKSGRNLLPDLGLPRPLKIALALVGIVFLLIIVVSIFSSSKKAGSSGVVGIITDAQEIARVSSTVESTSTDPDTKSLAATTSAVLTSQQTDLTSYLSSVGKKVSSKELASAQSTADDNLIQAAIQKDSLSSAYNDFLTYNLKVYQSKLQTAFNGTNSSKLKLIIKSAYDSSQTILGSLSN